MLKVLRLFVLTTALTISFQNWVNAEEHVSAGNEHKTEKFNASKLIMEHIADAYEWHIAKIGDVHVSIPLPVILYSKNSGFNVFMSGKFHHGTASYKGFSIAGEESKFSGKIVETGAGGEEIRPIDISITKNVMSLFFSIIILSWIFISVAKKYQAG
jgi:F-type H+-transporting ATPase subunit a